MNESISDCENSNDSDKEQQITTSNSSLSNTSNDNHLNKVFNKNYFKPLQFDILFLIY
jgi:hypothetical protein